MRLLEPVQGIKMAQGHFMTHLIFFTSMWFINTDITINLASGNVSGDGEASTAALSTLRAASYGIEMSETEGLNEAVAKETELRVFYLMKWGHIATFFFQMLFLYLKEKK